MNTTYTLMAVAATFLCAVFAKAANATRKEIYEYATIAAVGAMLIFSMLAIVM